mmetsp:Transcript_23591/g.20952  ORF Transcript_23591/g.20952 Transcript_23591/m.20952 type:complete len:119 (+) Transcript_23591:186-542(+)
MNSKTPNKVRRTKSRPGRNIRQKRLATNADLSSNKIPLINFTNERDTKSMNKNIFEFYEIFRTCETDEESSSEIYSNKYNSRALPFLKVAKTLTSDSSTGTSILEDRKDDIIRNKVDL